MPMQTLILGQDYKTDNGENSKLNEILFSTKDKSIVGINVRISRSVPNLFIPLQPQINNKKSQQKGMIHFSKRTIIHTNDKSKSQLFGVMIDSNTYRPNYFLIKIGGKIFSVDNEHLDNISSGAPTLSPKVEISKIPVYLSDELATKEANFTLTKFYEANYSSISNIEVEVDRYIVMPGQALSYKIGERYLLDLRNTVRKHKGSEFKIKEFHKVLLEHGALPLPVLGEIVREYYQI